MSPQDKLVCTMQEIQEKNDEFLHVMKNQHEEKLTRFDRFLELYERSLNNQSTEKKKRISEPLEEIENQKP